MTTNCIAEQRYRAQAAAAAIEAAPTVRDVTTIPAGEDPTGSWTVDVVLAHRAGGLPPSVARAIAEYDLTVRDVSPQGDYWTVLCVV